jgi:hypothetical protein
VIRSDPGEDWFEVPTGELVIEIKWYIGFTTGKNHT